ncbi:MAG TPA: hypothetical protein VHY91_07575 [Pirellulales bacterium]|jgi:hypothetical protein|nr:hypothetical protein [Pirellulales bacterium]
MRRRSRLQTALISIAALGLLAPPSVKAAGSASVPTTANPATANATAATPAASGEPLVIDVALESAGGLTGQVVGQDGSCAAEETVYVLRQGTVVGTCKTDATGHFALTGLTGGVYDVRWAHGVTICRLWAPETAPPSAKADLTLTANASAVRGQTGTPNPCNSLLKGPLPWIAFGVAVVGVIWWDVVVAQKHRYDRDHPSAS